MDMEVIHPSVSTFCTSEYISAEILHWIDLEACILNLIWPYNYRTAIVRVLCSIMRHTICMSFVSASADLGCGYITSSLQGALTDGSGLNVNYRNNLDCIWVILAPLNHSITIRIEYRVSIWLPISLCSAWDAEVHLQFSMLCIQHLPGMNSPNCTSVLVCWERPRVERDLNSNGNYILLWRGLVCRAQATATMHVSGFKNYIKEKEGKKKDTGMPTLRDFHKRSSSNRKWGRKRHIIWQRWDSNPRLRRDWSLNPAPYSLFRNNWCPIFLRKQLVFF